MNDQYRQATKTCANQPPTNSPHSHCPLFYLPNSHRPPHSLRAPRPAVTPAPSKPFLDHRSLRRFSFAPSRPLSRLFPPIAVFLSPISKSLSCRPSRMHCDNSTCRRPFLHFQSRRSALPLLIFFPPFPVQILKQLALPIRRPLNFPPKSLPAFSLRPIQVAAIPRNLRPPKPQTKKNPQFYSPQFVIPLTTKVSIK